jgi:phosphoribosylanthranilate isomerase
MKSNQVKVKICGITNIEDALACVEAGADALGFIFFKKSPRFISPEDVRSIIRGLPPFVCTVGVFVNETADYIQGVKDFTGIDTIQLHGDEPPKMASIWPRTIKAFRVSESTDLRILGDYRCTAFLFDTLTDGAYGGTGKVFDWVIALEAKRYGRIILSGGLNPDNVISAIRQVRPYAVDVSSGVESDIKGLKDHRKIRLFIERAKGALM